MAKNKRKRRPRLPSLRSLRLGNHKMWSLIVRALWPICTICCLKPSEQAHHLLNKFHFGAYRFTPKNGRGVCASCHLRIHGSPVLQTLALDPETTEMLLRMFREYRPVKWNRIHLTLVRAGLEAMYATLYAHKKEVAA